MIPGEDCAHLEADGPKVKLGRPWWFVVAPHQTGARRMPDVGSPLLLAK